MKNPQQNIGKLNLIIHEKENTHNQVRLMLEKHDWLNIKNSINIIHYIDRCRDQNHMIMSVNAEKGFENIKIHSQ